MVSCLIYNFSNNVFDTKYYMNILRALSEGGVSHIFLILFHVRKMGYFLVITFNTKSGVSYTKKKYEKESLLKKIEICFEYVEDISW